MHVISIQSQVAYGCVGNSAAVFPMQAAGLTVTAVPTTLLSNHPHYPTARGRVLDPDLVADLLRGIEERGLLETASFIVTGFLGSPEIGAVVAEFVVRARQRNPAIRYVCDPVMGDDDLGVFVANGLPELFRDRLVPMASHITPNQYELELLAGKRCRSADDLKDAAWKLRARGTDEVVVTGCVLDDTPKGDIETIVHAPNDLHRTVSPRLSIRPCGTGDLFTALLIVELSKARRLSDASARATRGVLRVLERTRTSGAMELQIVGGASIHDRKRGSRRDETVNA
nr:pyridoxal kinase [Notoacmeibacter marinus]